MRRKPGLKLERSPLILVLAQVRFSPVLKMRDYVPGIQEALRQCAFSWYREEQIQQVLFGPEVKSSLGNRWVFATRDRHEAIVLTNDFVVYETSHYDVFETFTNRLEMVLSLLKDTVKIDFAEQLGLRYVDLIRSIDGTQAKDLLRTNVRGLSDSDLGASQCRQHFLTKAVTPLGELFVRSVEDRGESFLPPDLADTSLDFGITPTEEAFRILDTDHIAKGQWDFDPKALVERMWELHGFSTKAFEAAVTPEAIEIWRKKGA